MKSRALVVWAVVLGLGLVLLVGSYLPLLNPEQCPFGYTQEQVDRSNCIIGANIGAGLARLFGILVAIAGGLGFLITVARRRWPG